MSRIASSGYLEQKAYNQIRDMIVNGELKPGDQIIQDQIAQKIGISRTPLRRAMTELERDHILETTSQGIFVRVLSNHFIVSVWEVRSVLEGLACRLCATRLDEATLAYFRTLFTSGFKKWEEGDHETYRQADVIFHSKLVEIADNPVLKLNFESSQVLTIAFGLGIVRPPEVTYGEHMAILDALEKGDCDLAEQRMLSHLRKTTPFLSPQK
jgi:DNA-binding GntR family transcriptional regulator